MFFVLELRMDKWGGREGAEKQKWFGQVLVSLMTEVKPVHILIWLHEHWGLECSLNCFCCLMELYRMSATFFLRVKTIRVLLRMNRLA